MNSNLGAMRSLHVLPVFLVLSVLVGCARLGLEYAPKGPYLYYHKELPAAERAVEAARSAGKDKECPEAFKAVEQMKDKAYEAYLACRTDEAIATANEAVKRASALCPPKKVAPAPPPPPPPAPKVIDRLAVRVNFDFDKTAIRDADTAELKKALEFVKKYPGYRISIEGHTDSIGTEQYNQQLSERRAAAVRAYLLKHGVANGARITSVGHGESKPTADNATKQGRFQNRRVEILILSE
jgi:outer membrane protein OmpA-like peptidoglycan-associated protein